VNRLARGSGRIVVCRVGDDDRDLIGAGLDVLMEDDRPGRDEPRPVAKVPIEGQPRVDALAIEERAQFDRSGDRALGGMHYDMHPRIRLQGRDQQEQEREG